MIFFLVRESTYHNIHIYSYAMISLIAAGMLIVLGIIGGKRYYFTIACHTIFYKERRLESCLIQGYY